MEPASGRGGAPTLRKLRRIAARNAALARETELEMKWESPSWTDIRMDAEIGSYQNDFDVENNQIRAAQEPGGGPVPIDAD